MGVSRSKLARRRRAIKRRFLAACRDDLGYTEGPNNATVYGRIYGMNNQPWCAMFVSVKAREAKVHSIVPRFAYTPAGAQYFKDRGAWGRTPRVGAIVFYDVSGMGRISHTGVVEKVLDNGTWLAIEGNTDVAGGRTGGRVMRQKRSTVGKRGGFGYPAYTDLARRELAG